MTKQNHASGLAAMNKAALESIPLDQLQRISTNRKRLEMKIGAWLQEEPSMALAIVRVEDGQFETDLDDAAFAASQNGHDATAALRVVISASTVRLAHALDKYQYRVEATPEERWNALSASVVSLHHQGFWPFVAPSDDGS